MMRYIIAVFLIGLSFGGFTMNQEDTHDPYWQDIKWKKWEPYFTDLIILSIKRPGGLYSKKIINVSSVMLAFGFKPFKELSSDPSEKINYSIIEKSGQPRKIHYYLTIEESEYKYFCILIKALHDVKQKNNIKGWSLLDLRNFIDLARKLDCIIDEQQADSTPNGQSICHFVEYCTKQLFVEEIENLLKELPLESIIKKGMLDGVQKFSAINYPNNRNLPKKFYKFSFPLVESILINSDFDVKNEDNFAYPIIRWLAAGELPKDIAEPKEEGPEKESYARVKALFNFIQEPKINGEKRVSNEEIEKLFKLIRYKYLTSEFVTNVLMPFKQFYPRAKAFEDIYICALEYAIVNRSKEPEKWLEHLDATKGRFDRARKSYEK